MVIAAIVIGIILVYTIFIALCLSDKKGEDFNTGMFMSFIISIFFIIEVILVGNIIKDPQPTAMDVYQGKTTLEYTIRDSVKIDSVVIFKDSSYGK
jgi:cytochrome bd-type quinol oxidase subunit 1